MKKRNILKFLGITAFIVFSLLSFVSCSDDSGIVTDRLVRVSVNSASKSLGTTFTSYNSEAYWWSYCMTKTDNEFASGATEGFANWRSGFDSTGASIEDAIGLEGQSHELSMGGWKITLRAYTAQTRYPSQLVYEGTTEFKNTEPNGSSKVVYVPLNYQDFEPVPDEVAHTSTRLKGSVKIDIPNIKIKDGDAALYDLDPSCTKHVTVVVRKFEGTVSDNIISETNFASAYVEAITKTNVDSGIYLLNIIYDYYKNSDTDKVASYIAADTFNVHGNIESCITGVLDFVSLGEFDIVYEDGNIKFHNGRETTPATSETDGGYTGDNIYVLRNEFSTYQYGTGLELATATSPSDNPCVRTGYTFHGWFKNKETTTSMTDVTEGTDQVIGKYDAGDKRLYAYWTPDKYTVTFYPNDESAGKGSTSATAFVGTTTKTEYETDAYYDDYLPKLNEITRKGYLFGGIYLNEFCVDGQQVYTSKTDTGSSVTTPTGYTVNADVKDLETATSVTDAGSYWKGTKDRNLYAKWIPEQTTLTLYNNKTAYSSMSDIPTIAKNTGYTAVFDRKIGEHLTPATLAGWKFEGYGVTADQTTGTDVVFNRMGVISNSDFGDADDNWIYDKYPTTENATTNLNLYAKWTPLKTHIILDASGASNGTDGEAWVEYDNTTLTSFTSVVPVLSTTTTVLGYFTRPENHGGEMILTSTGDFVVNSTTTNVPYQFFRTVDSENKWYKYNEQDEDEPLVIILYAHYEVDLPVNSSASTIVKIDWNTNNIKGYIPSALGSAAYQLLEVCGGWSYLDRENFSDTKKIVVPNKVGGEKLIGYYTSPDFEDDEIVAYSDGRLACNTDAMIDGKPLLNDEGKWIYNGGNITLYAYFN